MSELGDDRARPRTTRDVRPLIAAYRVLAVYVNSLQQPAGYGVSAAGNPADIRDPWIAQVPRVLQWLWPPRLFRQLMGMSESSRCQTSAPRRWPQSRELARLVHGSDESDGAESAGQLTLLVGSPCQPDPDKRSVAWRAVVDRAGRQSGVGPTRLQFVDTHGVRPDGDEQRGRQGTRADQVLSLVARHPLLTCGQLARLLDASMRHVANMLHGLAERGYLRWISAVVPATLGDRRARGERVVHLSAAGYRDSRGWTRDYASFPAVLVVTSHEPAADVITDQARLAHWRHGGEPLHILVTTASRIPAGVEACSSSYGQQFELVRSERPHTAEVSRRR